MSGSAATLGQGHGGEVTKRSFLKSVTDAGAEIGGAAFAWPLIDSMNPSQDVPALSAVKADRNKTAPRFGIAATRQGTPGFVRHCTPPAIQAAARVALPPRDDPPADRARVQPRRAPWIVPIGSGTHVGSGLLDNRPSDPRKEWGGCHGSQHDNSGRMHHGPAPANLAPPPRAFANDTKIKIG